MIAARLDRAAGRAAVRHRGRLSGQAARHQQRGPAPARLHGRGHPRGPPRVQDALPRGPVARRRAGAARCRRGACSRCSRRWSSSSRRPGAASSADAASRDARTPPRRPAPVDHRHRRRRGLGRRAGGDADRRRARAAAAGARFVGIAGPRMEAAGCEAWYPLETLSVRGFVEVRRRTCPSSSRIRRALARRLVAERVPVFVGVDAPDFNLGLERKLKRARRAHRPLREPVGVGVAARARRARSAASVDRMLALFPFEPPIYEAAGVPVTFVGHPLAQDAATAASRRETREQLQARHRAAGVRAAARQPRVRARDARRPRAARRPRRCTRRGPTRASSCRSRRARRATASRPRCYRLRPRRRCR